MLLSSADEALARRWDPHLRSPDIEVWLDQSKVGPRGVRAAHRLKTHDTSIQPIGRIWWRGFDSRFSGLCAARRCAAGCNG